AIAARAGQDVTSPRNGLSSWFAIRHLVGGQPYTATAFAYAIALYLTKRETAAKTDMTWEEISGFLASVRGVGSGGYRPRAVGTPPASPGGAGDVSWGICCHHTYSPMPDSSTRLGNSRGARTGAPSMKLVSQLAAAPLRLAAVWK